jgi:alpha-N-arabinofuranosidase
LSYKSRIVLDDYRNPVIPGFHPDPSVCRRGDDYYLVTSSFEYFPGVPLFHSTDLVNWRQVGHCLTRTSQLDLRGVPSSAGIWAPTIREHDGRFFMITTLVEQANFTNAPGEWRAEDWIVARQFLVTADDPAGEWSDPVWIDGAGIDPSLHFDRDGMVYLTHADRGTIYQSTFDVASGERTSPTRAIWHGSGEKDTEGPHLYEVGGRYYLLTAEGGTSYGHMVSLARSDSPWGPWKTCPWNPVLSHRSSGNPIQATGHADLVQGPDGDWWLVLLGIRPHGFPSFHTLGRETFLVPVRWEDDWLRAEALKPSAAERPATWHDAFTGPALDPRWTFLRAPNPAVNLNAETLVLGPSRETLDDVGSPAFVGCRQEQPHVSFELSLRFEPAADADEAGLTVLMNERHHCEIALRRVDGEVRAIFRRRIGSLVADEVHALAPAGSIRLRVDADPNSYSLSAANETGEELASGRAEAYYLSTEVAGGFTGVFVGPYCTGSGRALVDWFEVS